MEMLFEESEITNVKPIRDIVYDKLRKAILEGRMKTGERIVEKEYADKLNISRTPVREALRKLEIEGLVQYIPRKGVVVKGLCLKDIIEIYEIRKTLECLAVRNVIINITKEEIDKLKDIVKKMDEAEEAGDIESLYQISSNFHTALLNASSMTRLRDMINMLQDYSTYFTRTNIANDSRRSAAINEHRKILSAIIEKDTDKAEKTVAKHIENSRKAFIAGYQVNQ